MKAIRGGYDGRGVRMARDPVHAREIAAAFLADGVPVMAEEQVNLRRELSALVARSPFGQGRRGRSSRQCSATGSACR